MTRQQLKTENNKLNIYTQYLMKSTFETMTFFSQACRTCGTTHFIRPCTILHATGFGLPPYFEDCISLSRLGTGSLHTYHCQGLVQAVNTHITVKAWYRQFTHISLSRLGTGSLHTYHCQGLVQAVNTHTCISSIKCGRLH